MNWKTLTSILIVGTFCFCLDWFLRENQAQKKLDRLQAADSLKDKDFRKQLDSLVILSNTYDGNTNFKDNIEGHFVLDGAEYAGFEFISPKEVSWTNEMDAAHPDTLKIGWLNKATFFTQDVKQRNENCPPLVRIYQIILFDGHHLSLKEINTSWMINAGDSRLDFQKAMD